MIQSHLSSFIIVCIMVTISLIVFEIVLIVTKKTDRHKKHMKNVIHTGHKHVNSLAKKAENVNKEH